MTGVNRNEVGRADESIRASLLRSPPARSTPALKPHSQAVSLPNDRHPDAADRGRNDHRQRAWRSRFQLRGRYGARSFYGNRTTRIAAAACGRNSLGIEVDPVCMETALKRL